MPKADEERMLADDLCLFWHGIMEGKKQPVNFYTKKARSALRKEVERAIERYEKTDHLSADRLSRYWEFISIYISTQNEQTEGGKNGPSSFRLSNFLHLLYAGKPPSAFWRAFSKRHKIHSAPLASFWDYFEQFQPKRLEVAEWLQTHAKGKILDVGSGAHSYIRVHWAVDGSRAALSKNRQARRKIVADIDSDFDSWLVPNSFDTIMLNSVLAYVQNPIRLLKRCRRLLGKGGVLLITNAPVQAHHPANIFVKREVKARELKSWLKRASFEISSDDSTGQLVRLVARPRV